MTSLATSFSTPRFAARNGGFKLPKAEEILSANRKARFEQFADELDAMSVRDVITPMNQMRVVFEQSGAVLGIFDSSNVLRDKVEIDLDSRFLGQTATDLGLPADVLKRMISADTPEWRAIANSMVNQGLVDPLRDFDADRKRMVRVIDGKASANLGNGYLRVDNGPLKDWSLNLMRITNLIPVAWHMERGDFSMQLILPTGRNVARSNGLMDELFFGLDIGNSMTGGRSITNSLFTLRRVCDNGMMRTIAGDVMSRRHVGKRKTTVGEIGYNREEAAAVEEILFNASRSAERLISDDIIDAEVLEIRRAEDIEFPKRISSLFMEAKPVIRGMAAALGTTQESTESILQNLFANPTGGIEQGENPTLWGLANAITASANGAKRDKAEEMMALGGSILAWDEKKFKHTFDGLFNELAKA